jgi:hypothetical protein
MINDRKCLRIRHQPENYSELLTFPPKHYRLPYKSAKLEDGNASGREALERLEWVLHPPSVSSPVSTHPFCTSAPSKSGDSGDWSQPSPASVRQRRRTCKINHPATGDWKLRRNTQQQRGLRRPRFIIPSQERLPLPLPDPRSKEQAKWVNQFFDPIIIKNCPP